MTIADKLSNDERAAADTAVKRTFADLNPDERTVAEVAIWQAMHIPSRQLAMLAQVGAQAIYAERARLSRQAAVRQPQEKTT